MQTIKIALGFALATYLILNGMALLDEQKAQESNSSKVHSDTVK